MIRKILVVDDERDIKFLFEQRFRNEIKEGMLHFEFAFSGEEAFEYLVNYYEENLLILSDINMPGMNGLELLQKIIQEEFNPPPVVIMITAYQDQDTYLRAKELGATDYFTKPLDFHVLKDKLKSNWL